MDSATQGIEAEAPVSVAPRKQMLRRDRLAMWFISLLFLAVYVLVCVPGSPPEVNLRDAVIEMDMHGSVAHGWPWPFWVQSLSFEEMEPFFDEAEADSDEGSVIDFFYGSNRPAWQTAEGWRFSGKNINLEVRPWGIAGDLLVVVAALAIIRFFCVWRVRQRGSLFRYTLRDIVVVMTVAAIALGWWRQAMSMQEQDLATANAWLPESQFCRQYVGPKWLAKLVGERSLPFWRVVAVVQNELSPNRQPDADVNTRRQFDSFKELKILFLGGSPILPDLWLAAIKVESLEALGCYTFPELNDACLAAIDECELDTLSFAGPPKSLVQVEAISRFRTVRRLQFVWAPTSPEGVLEQIAKMPRLESLHFVVQYNYVPNATSKSLSVEHRAAPDLSPLGACRTLRRLTLAQAAIDDACIDALSELADVTRVRFLRCKASPSSIERLRALRPDLQIDEEQTSTP